MDHVVIKDNEVEIYDLKTCPLVTRIGTHSGLSNWSATKIVQSEERECTSCKCCFWIGAPEGSSGDCLIIRALGKQIGVDASVWSKEVWSRENYDRYVESECKRSKEMFQEYKKSTAAYTKGDKGRIGKLKDALRGSRNPQTP